MGLIGFISPAGAGSEDFIGPCYTSSCVHFGFLKIGFVLHKKGGFVEDSRQM